MADVTIETIVKVIAIAAFLGAVLWFFYPLLSGALERAGEKSKCNFSILFAAGGKLLSAGIGELPPECKAEYVTVDSQMIKQEEIAGKERIQAYAKEKTPFYKEAAIDFPEGNKEALDEWAVDSIIAKNAKSCWDKVLHGKLDFFKRYKIIDERTFCIVCSIVSFSDDLPSTVKSKHISNLLTWMKAETTGGTTYYDYLKEGMTLLPEQTMPPYMTNEPYAITYIETKISAALKWSRPIPEFTARLGGVMAGASEEEREKVIAEFRKDVGEDMNQIVLVPYASLQKDFACTDMIR